jgi:NADH-quinone oxidoreductase subunit C
MKHEDIVKVLSKKFGADIESHGEFRGEMTISVSAPAIDKILQFLKTEKNLDFNFLSDICGVDYVKDHGSFEVVYHLLSMKNNVRLRIKANVPSDKPEIPSVTPIYRSANWFERETYDMFGITFSGHPDLRRILNPDDFPGHPLRKDFDGSPKDEYCPVPIIKK